jgi:hypothetical protein
MPDNDAAPLAPPAPAALDHIKVPPQLVEACQGDPELLVALARGQLALVQDRLVRKVLNDPEASVGQMAAVHERLSKIARVENAGQQSNAGQQVTINIIRGEGRPAVTIEGTAQKVVTPDADA